MLKKFALIMLCALPIGLFAQEKLGHVNSQEIIKLMPELASVEKTIDELGAQWEGELLKMREEYNVKIKDYQEKQKDMADGIKQVRQSEIQEMEQRIATFQQTAYTDLQKKQQELVNPVIEKVRKAITDVATENKFTYIFDMSSQVILYTMSSQVILYTAPNSNDITALVKKKLGLK